MADVVRLSLQVYEGPVARETIVVSQSPAIVGRSRDVQVRLDSETVSREHASLTFDSGQWSLRDLGSRNGTKVNGAPTRQCALHTGDVVQIGGYALAVSIEGRPAEVTLFGEDAFDITTLNRQQGLRIDFGQVWRISELGQRLMEAADAAQRMVSLCRSVVDELKAHCAIVLELKRSDGQVQPVCEAAWSAEAERHGALPTISRSLVTEVLRNEVPSLASPSPSQPGMMNLSIVSSSLGVAAAICPLASHAESLDVLYAALPRGIASADWLALMELSASQFRQAEAVTELHEQTRRHAMIERDLARAREIQMQLVPEGSAEGLEVAIEFAPCRSVGGDYVDIIPTSDGRSALVLADVSGKGLPAALVMSSVHAAARALIRAGLTPRAVIEGINDYLCGCLRMGMFVTLVLVVLDPATGEFEQVNAGHPPALIVDRSGQVRRLASGVNLPLGIDTSDFQTAAGRLERGQVLVLYSDGVTDLMRGRETLGIPGLEDVIGKVLSDQTDEEPLARTRERINAALAEYRLAPQPDDATLLLARLA